MRLVLIIEDVEGKLTIEKPKVSVVELKGKNAVVIDFQVEPKRHLILSKKIGEIALNDRQLSFLKDLNKKVISNKDYRQFFKNRISTETSRSDLTDLVKKGILIKSGRLKGTIYRLNEQLVKET